MPEPLIVVPLDGSELSERAIPFATTLAKTNGARLLFLLVWEEADEALAATLPEVSQELFRTGEEYYEGYLKDVAKRAQAEGVKVDAETLTGRAVDEVLRVVSERDVAYLALSTHGRSGVTRWVYGSTAGRLIQEAPVPTLVVGPHVPAATGVPGVKRILVPLDGSELSEGALAPAQQLAEAFGADILLAEVLRWASQAYMFGVPETHIVQIDEELTKAAQAYLDKVREGMKTSRKVEAKVLHGFAADALMDLERDEGIDLVVMASHGRGGIVRAALGSVTDRMLQGPAPVLIVRPRRS